MLQSSINQLLILSPVLSWPPCHNANGLGRGCRRPLWLQLLWREHVGDLKQHLHAHRRHGCLRPLLMMCSFSAYHKTAARYICSTAVSATCCSAVSQDLRIYYQAKMYHHKPLSCQLSTFQSTKRALPSTTCMVTYERTGNQPTLSIAQVRACVGPRQDAHQRLIARLEGVVAQQGPAVLGLARCRAGFDLLLCSYERLHAGRVLQLRLRRLCQQLLLRQRPVLLLLLRLAGLLLFEYTQPDSSQPQV